ncbi:metallophosphoesterase family protein [Caldisericum exile]|uniref:Nuclease SbcCD subunit D n=1 Tax=Caldisericum exile (strain DSM 21853 / NBRC 104410 / AZM16c01) TaxID=511051 RepID=A0A7U6JFE2_CALEA|nr:exonuclease SbcCD subunit D [Caldisericum exile]BAL80344.1 putative exonuclease [Caldisericum exile AZM16c01]
MRFFHLADLHIGFPLKSGENNFNFQNTLDFVVEKAKEYKIDVVVIAGDVFHKRDPEVKDERLFARFINALANLGIEILVVTGNHEGAPFRERIIHLDLYSELSLGFINISKIPEVINIKGFNFLTLPYPFKTNILSKEEFRDLSEDEVLVKLNERLLKIIDELLESVRDKNNILVAHIPVSEGTVGYEQFINFSKYLPLSINELDRENILYFALGHLHKNQVLESQKYKHKFVYPGSLDRLDFSEENDPKGFFFVEVLDSVKNTEFIENPFARKFYTVEIFDDKSFEQIDFDRAKQSIVRVVVKGNVEDEGKLRAAVNKLKEVSYVFTQVIDERSESTPVLSSIYEVKDPIKAIEEYLDKSENQKYKKIKEQILEEARNIMEQINE